MYFILGCFSPIITLFPGTSSLTEPIEFRRSENFYISSYIEVNCIASLSIITQWTIFNCTTTCSLQAIVDQSVITTFSELFILARTLAYGLYKLNLTVTMVASPDLTSSASAYVRINPSNIMPNLIKFGTSMITGGQEQDLTLEPGTWSVNPDETTFTSNVNYHFLNIYMAISNLSLSLVFRIGSMNTTVDLTIRITLKTGKHSVRPIIHVSQIDRV
jgi:hypothetical protein